MTSFLKYSTYFTLSIILAVILGISGTFLYLAPKLPDVQSLTDIRLQIPLRIYTNDGELIGEFGDKRRTPVEIENVPDTFIKAFLAAEDDQFYQHNGVSYKGLGRAVYQMLSNSRTQTGGSTITMQVAKNYFLTPEKTIIRKLREIFLSLQIEAELSKNEILELYVNKIFLGHRSYGISAAAQVYYNKSVSELSLAEMAMIAGLPKAPSAYNPIANPQRALTRRNWILGRMASLGYISEAEKQEAISQAISAQRYQVKTDINAPYVAEMVRQQAHELFGDSIYTDGLIIYTTINGKMQRAAQQSVQKGILAYDARHGYRGPEYRLKDLSDESKERFFENNRTITGMLPAIVIEVNDKAITAELDDGTTIELSAESLKDLRLYETEDIRIKWKSLNDIASPGKAIRLLQHEDGSYQLTQLPAIQGALVALNSYNGAILSMVGGFEYYQSKFNRATQAKRQIGSNIKPFIYAAALSKGYTASSLINDAPVVFNDSQLENTWRPNNADNQFLGPIRLREALYRSRNLVSVRLLQQIGLIPIINYLEQFGFEKDALPKDLSLSLGSPNFTPLTVAKAYATFSNQGYSVEPFIISEIKNTEDHIIFQANPSLACDQCEDTKDASEPDLKLAPQDSISQPNNQTASQEKSIPVPQDSNENPNDQALLVQAPRYSERIIHEDIAFIIDDILKDVVKKGTATKARSLRRPDIAGKTGTTNGPTDAWFSGYTPKIVVSTWIGFDDNRNLGRGEYGGTAALPIWIDFMHTALQGQDIIKRQTPNNITNVLISKSSGLQANANDTDTMFEYIRSENLPSIENTSEDGPGDDIEIDEIF